MGGVAGSRRTVVFTHPRPDREKDEDGRRDAMSFALSPAARALWVRAWVAPSHGAGQCAAGPPASPTPARASSIRGADSPRRPFPGRVPGSSARMLPGSEAAFEPLGAAKRSRGRGIVLRSPRFRGFSVG